MPEREPLPRTSSLFLGPNPSEEDEERAYRLRDWMKNPLLPEQRMDPHRVGGGGGVLPNLNQMGYDALQSMTSPYALATEGAAAAFGGPVFGALGKVAGRVYNAGRNFLRGNSGPANPSRRRAFGAIASGAGAVGGMRAGRRVLQEGTESLDDLLEQYTNIRTIMQREYEEFGPVGFSRRGYPTYDELEEQLRVVGDKIAEKGGGGWVIDEAGQNMPRIVYDRGRRAHGHTAGNPWDVNAVYRKTGEDSFQGVDNRTIGEKIGDSVIERFRNGGVGRGGGGPVSNFADDAARNPEVMSNTRTPDAPGTLRREDHRGFLKVSEDVNTGDIVDPDTGKKIKDMTYDEKLAIIENDGYYDEDEILRKMNGDWADIDQDVADIIAPERGRKYKLARDSEGMYVNSGGFKMTRDEFVEYTNSLMDRARQAEIMDREMMDRYIRETGNKGPRTVTNLNDDFQLLKDAADVDELLSNSGSLPPEAREKLEETKRILDEYFAGRQERIPRMSGQDRRVWQQNINSEAAGLVGERFRRDEEE